MAYASAVAALLLVGTTVGVVTWLFVALSNRRILIQRLAVSDTAPAVGPLFGIGVGLAIGLLYGGLACIQHIALRLVLWRIDAMPLRLISFLDYASSTSSCGGSVAAISSSTGC
jgi:hypothetical protein